jgi:hypothetical protein
VSARWVLKMLTKEHKSKRMDALLLPGWRRIIHGKLHYWDGTWVYEFTPELKRNSMTWKHPHSPVTKKFKIELSEKNNGDRVLGLWISPTKNNNQQWQILWNSWKSVRSHWTKDTRMITTGGRLQHNGARPHTSAQIAAWLQKWKWEVLQHPPHSPDLAPSDLYLFAILHIPLKGTLLLRNV